MANIASYLEAGQIGVRAAQKVGGAGTAFAAGGYAAFVDAVTGSVPQIVDRPDGGIALVQTKAQNQMLGNWVENQMLDSMFKRKPAGKVSYEIGPAFTPVAVKYAIPVTVVIFAAGLLVGRMIR